MLLVHRGHERYGGVDLQTGHGEKPKPSKTKWQIPHSQRPTRLTFFLHPGQISVSLVSNIQAPIIRRAPRYPQYGRQNVHQHILAMATMNLSSCRSIISQSSVCVWWVALDLILAVVLISPVA